MSHSRVAARAPILGLIGNTPLLALDFPEENRIVYAKAEFLNPSGSIKDRLASYILLDAQERGLLKPDSIILECTSGNTGIALAAVGAALGYAVKIVMSDTASIERRHLMRQLGAELVLFKATEGYATGIKLTRELAASDARYFLPCQFENPLNARDHAESTGPEILRQLDGPADLFVSGYGTGGTLAGVGRALRAANPKLKIMAMEPTEAAMLSGELPCCHLIEGVAGGYVPPLLSEAQLDGAIKVSSADAIAMAQRLSREFGLLVGTSSGANVVAALKAARDLELHEGARIVTILADRAERYYSTKLFAGVPDR